MLVLLELLELLILLLLLLLKLLPLLLLTILDFVLVPLLIIFELCEFFLPDEPLLAVAVLLVFR